MNHQETLLQEFTREAIDPDHTVDAVMTVDDDMALAVVYGTGGYSILKGERNEEGICFAPFPDGDAPYGTSAEAITRLAQIVMDGE